MRALIYKDFMSAKLSYMISFMIIIAISCYALYQGTPLLIPLLFIYMPVIFSGLTFGSDDQADFPKFIFTTPIPRWVYVTSKYVPTFVFSMLGLASSFYLFYQQGAEIPIAFVFSLLIILVPVLLTSIQIPFFLKYGTENGRIIMIGAFFILFAMTSLFGKQVDLFKRYIQNIEHYLTATLIALVLVNVIILVLSIFISTHIVNHKEY
ncbi:MULTISPECIES: ABC-2 transporter permease [Aerococcus]|uniref:ABC-2 transporter permease n=1 Tax=Aerococcus TaxID=1375 RepID=UPI000DCBF735|nr:MULTISPECIES: ABC-2 transporter permease [Aerococcus]KAA9295938.1 ABC-2 transporter permease [Aerococcus tenax]MDK6689307.1 ABC-2 transporter permease [Aerococcus urinae]MDK8133731.1 ABC-2 transporter permease [Aerococcus urinae]MDK8485432.1 ABC-2 transporter permease [Aerococcus urinae]MDL5177783.1 ABC-2 transporter permease [Aerococcus tenax]